MSRCRGFPRNWSICAPTRDVIKDRFAQAINAALPHFDLVIVDEAHNLKHGWGPQSSSRNRVLATVLGRERADLTRDCGRSTAGGPARCSCSPRRRWTTTTGSCGTSSMSFDSPNPSDCFETRTPASSRDGTSRDSS
ncbi:hypothetical protein V2I01_38700 [Micromonospora sp. BRA006-A]|nr:hypothetical protein [Micromonospora sp. BRA006-A]